MAYEFQEDRIVVVVVDDAAALVGIHLLDLDDTYQSATGAHGRIVYERPDCAPGSHYDARWLARDYLRRGYRRNGGIDIMVGMPPIEDA
jgi:hypothetical protein